ncbi:MAG TPA: family 16 glycoside hydrolase [Gemmatimonadales bacterium]|nr:family 16 glycoside hydrolase [Gemmatimonadales bacterium]
MANSLKRLLDAPDPINVQRTSLAADIPGRYICNTFQEALCSAQVGPCLDRTDARPDARPFDLIIIGGGTFGSAMAEHLWFRDKTRSHRILVLEAGPFAVPEHVQNLAMTGLGVADPTTVEEYNAKSVKDQEIWRKEVWGLAWRGNTKFPGLAYCPGGRSLYWGGWSPQLLDAEMPPAAWPGSTVGDLKSRYFAEAARQIAVNETNDFIYGDLHRALRKQLFDGIGTVPGAIALNALPNHPALTGVTPTLPLLLELLGLSAAGTLTPDDLRNLLKLEAPLAVEGRPPRAGFFPFNKFSALPLLIKAARAAQAECNNDDIRKRLMVVPNCHVMRLATVKDGATWRVTGVETNLGLVPVPTGGKVFIALGTIESTRLALASFKGMGMPNEALIGRNFMAHLRSNLDIRIPRTALTGLTGPQELQTSALFVKGKLTHADGTVGHFHLQITASGLGGMGADSEAELFKKVPDIDTLDAFKAITDTHVVITIRGIGEMQSQNPDSNVTLDLDPNQVDFGVRRAYAMIADPRAPGQAATNPRSKKDLDLWDAMDQAADAVAAVFAGGPGKYEVLRKVRDDLGTTHHETGTLWMGDDPTKAVTNAVGRFHHVPNAYVLGPALLPTIGSPNPMLTGIALIRRTGDTILPPPSPPAVEAGFTSLFDGTDATFKNWQAVGRGTFSLIDGLIVAYPGNDLGLLYFAPKTFGDFELRLQFRLETPTDNSGVFVRSRDPRLPVPDRNNPAISYPYNNQAWVAVHTGFEVQIDEQARPNGFDKNRTAAIYDIPTGTNPGQQDYRRGPALQPGVWNDYTIKVQGNLYGVWLNGQATTTFTNTDGFRGKSPAQDPRSGYIGLQAHTGRVAFRNIRLK